MKIFIKIEMSFSQVKLCVEEWLPDSGLVTAALKIRRKQIQQFYQRDIDALYAEPMGISAWEQWPSHCLSAHLDNCYGWDIDDSWPITKWKTFYVQPRWFEESLLKDQTHFEHREILCKWTSSIYESSKCK